MGVGAVVAGVGLATTAAVSYSNAQSSKKASNKAAQAQVASNEAAIKAETDANKRMEKLLAPYTNAGYESLTTQQDLLGLNGNYAQANAIEGIKTSSQFKELAAQGENSILQNASATGGLRGGNTQAALAQFSPALLNSLINDQYVKLGGITSIGANAAAQTGNSGMQSANSVSQLLLSQGQATAGGILGSANAINSGINTGFNLLGNYSKYSGGWGGLGSSSAMSGMDTSIPTWTPQSNEAYMNDYYGWGN